MLNNQIDSARPYNILFYIDENTTCYLKLCDNSNRNALRNLSMLKELGNSHGIFKWHPKNNRQDLL